MFEEKRFWHIELSQTQNVQIQYNIIPMLATVTPGVPKSVPSTQSFLYFRENDDMILIPLLAFHLAQAFGTAKGFANLITK